MKLLLFIMVSFVALSSIFSGLLLMNNPDGSVLNLPHSLLEGTFFSDFRMPGILLTVIVGGSNLMAVFYNIQRHRNRYNWALAGGGVTIVWVLLQMALLHSIHWLNFFYLAAGIMIVLISFQLKGKAIT